MNAYAGLSIESRFGSEISKKWERNRIRIEHQFPLTRIRNGKGEYKNPPLGIGLRWGEIKPTSPVLGVKWGVQVARAGFEPTTKDVSGDSR
jgi:hypothetical protein